MPEIVNPTIHVAQVAFPATQSASADVNTLDDYEEGSWTPVVAGSTGAGTYELDALTACFYQKIGNTVRVWARIILAGAVTGGGTGALHISGLPFPMSGTQYTGVNTISVIGIAFTGSFAQAVRAAGTATSTLLLRGIDNAGTATAIPITAVGASDQILFELSYIA